MKIPSYIDLGLIRGVLQLVLVQEISREEASEWANKVRIGLKEQRMSYFPTKDERAIWHAIILVQGIDLMDSPISYLHNTEDLLEWDAKLENDMANSAS